MEEKVKDYINADLASLSFEEFSEKFDTVKPDNNNFIDNLEWALLYLNAEKTASPIRYNEMKESLFNLNTFDGAWLIDVDRVGSDEKNGLGFFRPLGTCQATLNMFKDFNVKIFGLGAGDKDAMTYLQKFRLMEPKEVRHIKGLPKVIERRYAVISKDEKWYTTGDYQLNKEIEMNGNIVSVPVPTSINPNYYIRKEDISEHIKSPEYMELVKQYNMAMNVKLTGYYEWFVYIKEDEKSLGVKIPVAPEAAKEVFALRETQEGARRKKAICHFVKEHYRTVKSEYNEEERQTLVKQHLRGETKFNWRGLQVHIIPAEYDLNRIKTKKKFVSV